jgi:nitrite reductase/ring-hydroxylating ferredoxin subunit/multimeric flavodoxin WrbA
MSERWVDAGSAAELQHKPLQQLELSFDTNKVKIALTYKDGDFSAVSGVCNHVGGPLGEGTLDGDYIVCPWHYWKFHCRTGLGEPGFEEDAVPRHEVKVESGRVLVNLTPATKRSRKPHDPHPLARKIVRDDGPIRVVGISTTAMTREHPRYSTSDALLETALAHSKSLGCGTQLIRLNELQFRACEGYYSKSARACTWPCSITQMDPKDQLERVYEAFVHWADVLLLATPIRWGAASGLYYKMIERMNCIQNQETIANRYLLKNKVAAFVITGGQDNVQGVAGQMLGFFAEVGCQFPQFPFIAHSRGWSAEDMENNVRYVRDSEELRNGARALAERSVEMARLMIAGQLKEVAPERGGRKAHQLDVKAQI